MAVCNCPKTPCFPYVYTYAYEGERPTLTGPRCASVHGFSLHANTQVPADRRDQLEHLLRYTARGPEPDRLCSRWTTHKVS
jgi:hypothetical protein